MLTMKLALTTFAVVVLLPVIEFVFETAGAIQAI